MSGTQPIDPASCEPDRWYLVRALGGHERAGLRLPRGAWYVPGETPSTYEDGDGRLTVLAELVRRDKAQAIAEWLAHEKAFEAYGLGVKRGMSFDVRTAKSAAEYWKAECEKAQAERDEWAWYVAEARWQRDRLIEIHTLPQWKRDLLSAADVMSTDEHGPQVFETGGHKLTLDRTDNWQAVDPDPTSASRLRLAAETLEARAPGVVAQGRADPLHYGTYPSALRRQADEIEAAVARERERDAEIAAVARRLHDNDDTTTGTIGWDELMEATRHRYRDKAEVAIAALDAVRTERGQA